MLTEELYDKVLNLPEDMWQLSKDNEIRITILIKYID
jgi:hypothetical protein